MYPPNRALIVCVFESFGSAQQSYSVDDIGLFLFEILQVTLDSWDI